MDQPVRYKRFETRCFESCVSLLIEVFNGPPWNDKWTQERATCWLMSLTSGNDFRGFCGFDGNCMIAAVLGRMKMWWRGEEYYIEEMFVRASVQGKGIGSRLLDYVESELKKEMVQAITLATNSDMPAREFYAKNGFHPVDDLVFMKKKL